MRINKIGVEIEGGWDRQAASTIKHDGSVNIQCSVAKGEVVSPPMNLSDATEWMRQNYPCRTNNTCGIHVHFSFKRDLDYARLMDDDFEEVFLEKMKEWGTDQEIPEDDFFWRRIEGEYQYCKKEWTSDLQVVGGHHRYTQWNFQARNKFGTAECRILPSFDDPEMAVSAVEYLVDVVEDYLVSTPRPTQIALDVEVEVAEEDGPLEVIHED